MGSNIARRFAVLVGIDLYDHEPDPKKSNNLRGCVNDIKSVSQFLQSELQIPPSQITTLEAPNVKGSKIDFSVSHAPTRKNLLSSLQSLVNEPPGAFIYFQYSGHGYRYRRRLRKGENRNRRHKEFLCTWETWTTDTELGDILDKLSEKHTVCAVLDCCHSGGADRDAIQDEAARSDEEQDEEHNGDQTEDVVIRSFNPFSGETPSLMSDLDDGGDSENEEDEFPNFKGRPSGMRDATLPTSDLYRERKYNLIAAAQASEVATECTFVVKGGKRVRSGVLTHYLLQSLSELRGSTDRVTYRLLQSSVDARVKNLKLGRRRYRIQQHPLHLGNSSRFLFSSDSSAESSLDLLANVNHNTSGTVTIDRGAANNVSVGDRFWLRPFKDAAFGLITAQSQGALVFQVDNVQELESTASWSHPAARPLAKAGYIAQLLERTPKTRMRIHLPNMLSEDALRIKQECAKYEVRSLPMDLSFTSGAMEPGGKVDFIVTVKQKLGLDVQIIASNDQGNTRATPAIGPDNPKQLMEVLHHLCTYQLAANINFPSITNPGVLSTLYDFDCLQQNPDGKSPPGAVAMCELKFKNRSPSPVYITILNLTPAFGVQAILPGPESSSEQVAPGLEKTEIIDMFVPDFLKHKKQLMGNKQQPIEMRDVLKLFVVTQKTDFRHYQIPNLEIDHNKVDIAWIGPQTKHLLSEKCVIEEKVISTLV
ncbi:hypothetical protein AYO21_00633 [Fonsecaea monophora]|uniref:Peptidase C14 caspase domain-containing protein n=1 Tax=Fonsecaea monophora TaxID=254056 RepID=A0A177FLZ8_9EURO|nr:hypothetical protein AYO21_00633 [Fonsecaea monophora]KAH0840714.1 hypothetical protein FOPE_05721 [Fonsecaea pedrosoi]OAG45285.1 hypothetical protein AYO21_00633 [Fonsecaea monophora]